MAINTNKMLKDIKDALDNYNNGAYKNELDNPRHMQIMADAIKKHIEDNCQVLYAWAATNPSSGVPDPVVVMKATVKIATFTISSPMSLQGLALQLQAGIAGAIIKPQSGFTVPTGTFLCASPPTLPPTTSKDADALNLSIITPFCTWLKTCLNPTPLAGSHTAFTGAATMSTIL